MSYGCSSIASAVRLPEMIALNVNARAQRNTVFGAAQMLEMAANSQGIPTNAAIEVQKYIMADSSTRGCCADD